MNRIFICAYLATVAIQPGQTNTTAAIALPLCLYTKGGFIAPWAMASWSASFAVMVALFRATMIVNARASPKPQIVTKTADSFHAQRMFVGS